jgi:hypothetical protein
MTSESLWRSTFLSIGVVAQVEVAATHTGYRDDHAFKACCFDTTDRQPQVNSSRPVEYGSNAYGSLSHGTR